MGKNSESFTETGMDIDAGDGFVHRVAVSCRKCPRTSMV